MKIGINGYYLTTLHSGIGQYTYNLLKALAELDTKTKFYIFVTKEIDDLDLPSNFIIRIIKPLPFFQKTFLNRYLWEEYQLGNAIKEYHIDVFHAPYQSLPLGVEHIGNVVTIHDAIPWQFPFERKNMFYRWYSDKRKDLIKKRAQKIITISERSKIDIAPIYDLKPETLEVTYESVNPLFKETPKEEEVAAFKEKYHVEKEYILYVGGLKRHKNLRMLIKAFAILVEEHNFTGNLYILGAIRNTMAVSNIIYNKVEDLEKYAKLKKVYNQIKFVNEVNEEELSLFYHLASCFISISLYEGFGLPALEAITAGTPCVLSNLGAYPEIAGDAALFVYPYGPHRIADALNTVLTVPQIQATLKENAAKRALFFDRITIAKRILEIYHECYDDYKIKFQP